MSRHHMLPPVIYTPPPPKKVEKKTRRSSVGMFADIDEAAEAGETGATGHSAPVGLKLPPAQMPEIESSDRKPQGPSGRLSQGTLTELLRAQELK